jgi:hypothetical protein
MLSWHEHLKLPYTYFYGIFRGKQILSQNLILSKYDYKNRPFLSHVAFVYPEETSSAVNCCNSPSSPFRTAPIS